MNKGKKHGVNDNWWVKMLFMLFTLSLSFTTPPVLAQVVIDEVDVEDEEDEDEIDEEETTEVRVEDEIAVTDRDGNITDVRIDYSEGYVEQHLRYSRDYSDLPDVN